MPNRSVKVNARSLLQSSNKGGGIVDTRSRQKPGQNPRPFAPEDVFRNPGVLAPDGRVVGRERRRLRAAGIPTVLFGPLGAGAHAAEEWVDLASVQRCADVYLATAAAFCA